MAHITDTRAFGTGLRDRVAALRADIATRFAEARVYRQTMNELSQLTDRELADLGIHRSMIRGIAREAAQKA